MDKSKIIVNITDFIVTTKKPDKFIKDLVKLCKKHSGGKKGWFFRFNYND